MRIITPTTDGEKQSVVAFFTRIKCCPPREDLIITSEGRHRCTLEIDGVLTFISSEGALKKQQAEQQAAKEALRHLEGLLGGKSSSLSGVKNYKGLLQELLAKHGSGSLPEYSTPFTPTLGSTAALGHVTKSSSVIGSLQQATAPSISHAASKDLPSQDSAPPPTKTFSEMKSDGLIKEVRKQLDLLGLPLESVVCEDVSTEQQYECKVDVSLDRFTFHPSNNKLFGTKKEASRSSYTTLGVAGGICQHGESRPKEKVIQFFAQQDARLPKEVFEEPEAQTFSCSLSDITCVFTYTGGKESSEVTARRSACHLALSSISPLIGHCSPVVLPESAKEAELRLKTVLEGAGLKFSVSVLKVEYKSSATLKFSGFYMEMKGQTNKKLTRSNLSQRLLKLLENDTTSSATCSSMRNALDEWFAKRQLDKPVFQDTDDQRGIRVTFSAPLHCSYTDWQDSQEKAEKRLLKELVSRLQVLSESD